MWHLNVSGSVWRGNVVSDCGRGSVVESSGSLECCLCLYGGTACRPRVLRLGLRFFIGGGGGVEYLCLDLGVGFSVH